MDEKAKPLKCQFGYHDRMRPLICPVLIAVARLGLFLSVVAWIVAQWRIANVMIDVPGTHVVQVVVAPEGIVVCDLFPYDVSTNISLRLFHRGTVQHLFAPSRKNITYSVSFGGLVYGTHSAFRFVSFRHWLIITAFALYYAVLKWVIRKRVVPDE